LVGVDAGAVVVIFFAIIIFYTRYYLSCFTLYV
jgi:hypothetical protein